MSGADWDARTRDGIAGPMHRWGATAPFVRLNIEAVRRG